MLARLAKRMQYVAPVGGGAFPRRQARSVTGRIGTLSLTLFLGTMAYSGFLPTSIRTVMEAPRSTLTDRPVFSEGETFEASTWFKAMAARICSASWSSGRPLMDSNPVGVSTDMPIPVDTLRSTAKSLSPWIRNCGMPMRIGSPFILFHPANSNSSLISDTRSKHSWSPQVPINTYSVPLNVLSGAATGAECESLLGVVSRSNSAVSIFALFVASARCDSASSACFLADLMSASNESASLRACPAMIRAFDDAVWAPLASASALPRYASAAPALDSASLPCESAVDESAIASLAFVSASSALSPSDPITTPDSSLVRTRQISEIDNAATRSIVERLSRCFLRSFPRQPSPRSATSSPAHARITKASETYSAISQRCNDCDSDKTPEAVKIILPHYWP